MKIFYRERYCGVASFMKPTVVRIGCITCFFYYVRLLALQFPKILVKRELGILDLLNLYALSIFPKNIIIHLNVTKSKHKHLYLSIIFNLYKYQKIIWAKFLSVLIFISLVHLSITSLI